MKEYHICYRFTHLNGNHSPEIHYIFYNDDLNVNIHTRYANGHVRLFNTNKTIYNIKSNDLFEYLIEYKTNYEIKDDFFTLLDGFKPNVDRFIFEDILKISINHNKNIIRKLKIKKVWTI